MQMIFDFLSNETTAPARTTSARKRAVVSPARPKRTRRDPVASVASPALTSQEAFVSPVSLTLADVKAKAEADWTLNDTQRRDIVSASSRIEKVFSKPLSTLDASPRCLRALFASKSAAQVGLSDKSFANIRSLSVQALSRYAEPDRPVTRRFAMTPAWRQLLDRIEKPYNRQTLHRLAIYCSRMGVSAEDVTPDTLMGFKVALEAEEVVKDPAEIVSNTISKWNGAMRDVPGWPQHKLSEPNQEVPLARPLGDFPMSFQIDVETWHERMADPDPLDEEAPAKPLRPATLAHRLYTFRSFASALVASGYCLVTDITSLDVLLRPEAFKAGIRFFHERSGKKLTQRVHNMAKNLRLIGKNYCKFDDATLALLEGTCKRLDPGTRHQMTERNRQRLGQFDDERNVEKLLHFPEREATWAQAQTNPFRKAKGMERAVAVTLLTFCGLRISSLRTLELSDFRFLDNGRCHLFVPPERIKNGRSHESDLNPDITALLRDHLAHHRLEIPGASSPFLFPGPYGRARSKNSMSNAICNALRKRAGLEMNVHLFRHTIGKIGVERDPGAYLAVSRVLGHTSLDTTMAHYLGTEARAAARHLDRLLTEAKEDSKETGKVAPKHHRRRNPGKGGK